MANEERSSNPKAGIYCDCNSQAGVFTYTLRMLDMFRAWGWPTCLLSHEARTTAERQTSTLLSNKADSTLLIDRDLSPRRQITRMEDFLRQEQARVFIPNYRKLPWDAAVNLSRSLPIQIVAVCHSDHESYYDGSIKRYIEQISFCVCPSIKTRQELRKRLPAGQHHKLRHIPHYVRIDGDQKAEFSASPFTVVYHGRLREDPKHVSEIIKIAARACKNDPNIHFKLIGDNQEHDLYPRLIREQGLSDRCTLHEPLDWAALQKELVGAQLSILTSAYEGFCYTAAEALSAGLPVVAYDCGDVITDFVDPGVNGFIEAWGDAEALAQRIRMLARNPEIWSRYSRKALDTAKTSLGFEMASARYRDAIEHSAWPGTPWPRWRPTYIPPTGKSWRSFVDRTGRRIGVW